MAEVVSSSELVEEPSDYGHLRAGTKLGRYELLVPVARGGMARVWAARQHGQHGFQKLVAIKTILPELAREPEFQRMFLDEARIASGIHHPNVCEIYELGEDQRVLYMAMEWVNGDSLARLLRPNGAAERLDVRVAARIVADACAGAHAAHELEGDRGEKLAVVHRDLSPHNVLITLDGVGKVCDFGVAKAFGQLHDATSAGQLKGKIAYMAPEQITGGAIDRRSDIFSLGCLLYEASTGERPFKGEGDHQVMHAVLKGEFAAPSTLVRDYPIELERIVQRALASQPVLRYPTAERMWAALEEFLAQTPVVRQADVGRALRGRLAAAIEKRKERIRAAQPAGDASREGPPSSSPKAADPQHRSGVKEARRPAAAPIAVKRPSVAPPLPSGRPSAPPPALPSARPSAFPPRPTTPDAQAAIGKTDPPPPSLKTEPSAPDPAAKVSAASKRSGEAAAKAPPPRASVAPPKSASPSKASAALSSPPKLTPAPAPVSAKAPSVAKVASAAPQPPPIPSVRPAAGAPASSPPAIPKAAALPRLDEMPEGDDAQEATAVMYPMTPQPPPTYTPTTGPYSGHFRTGPQLPPNAGGWAPAAPYVPGPYPVPPSSSHPYPPVRRSSETAQYVLAAVMGLAAAGLIGAAAYIAFAPSDAPSSSSKAEPVTSASREVVLETTPRDAEVYVDGKRLPPGPAVVTRPAVGTVLAVTVRAPARRDRTVLVDFFSPPKVTVALEDAPPAAIVTAPASAAASVAPPAAAAVPSAPKVDPAPAPKVSPSTKTEPAALPKPEPVRPDVVRPTGKTATPKADPPLPANPY